VDSNTHSTQPAELPENLELPELPEGSERPGPLAPLGPLELPELADGLGSLPATTDELAGLPVVVGTLAAQDLDRLSEAALTRDTLVLQRWLACLDGQWLRRLAAVDARGAAGADQGQPAPSTAGWLGRRLRMGAGAAREAVRTARALFRGPLTATADALVGGQLSAAHAQVLAQGTRPCPTSSWPTLSRCWWRPPSGWIRRGWVRPLGTCSRWPTPTGPTPSVVMPAGGCGCRRPWTAWSR
jgi:hypothetical protein